VDSIFKELNAMRKGFLIDMDGVIYRGNNVIPGAIDFINQLSSKNIPFVFVTNNSQRTPKDIAIRLQRLGFDIGEEHVYTSAMATAEYVSSQKPAGTAYVIGEGGILNALHSYNYAIVDSKPDFVIIGEGRTLTLESIEKAVRMVCAGAKLIATNLDPSCPCESGDIRPGCGAIVKMIQEATGCGVFSPGKPCPLIFRGARKQISLSTEEVIMVGDTMETDILGGVQLGYTTVLVLTGGTSPGGEKKFAFSPDFMALQQNLWVEIYNKNQSYGRFGRAGFPQLNRAG
jgi:NagD protein